MLAVVVVDSLATDLEVFNVCPDFFRYCAFVLFKNMGNLRKSFLLIEQQFDTMAIL